MSPLIAVWPSGFFFELDSETEGGGEEAEMMAEIWAKLGSESWVISCRTEEIESGWI